MALSVDWMRQHEQWGVLDPDSEKPGLGQCLWNTEAHMKQCKVAPDSNARTLYEVLEKSKDKYGSRRAVGWRHVVKVHQEADNTGAMREKIELRNEYQWLTYAEYYNRVLCLARGLACWGVEAKSKIVIYAETQADWMVSAFAAWQTNCQVVTIYATLGEEGAVHGINETEATTIVTDSKLMKVVSKALKKCPNVKHVVTMKPCEEDVKKSCPVEIKSIDDLVDLGKTYNFSPAVPTAADVAVIMYTSGTTGTPKGVVLSHANIVACLAGVEHALKGLIVDASIYCAYLPLAHIMEMSAEIAFMGLGVSIGFGTPHTLTDAGVKLKRPESMGDAALLKPTIMVFAPAVLDKVYQAVQNKREGLGGLGQMMFRLGLNSGERRFGRDRIGANPLFNQIVFKKVQAMLGGNVKAMVTGSAPLAPEIQKYVQTVLRAPARQGYGLTETCAGSCIAFWGDNQTKSVGPPTVSTVIRLADWLEGNYLNADKDKPEIGMRRGEVLIGGPCVCQGYFISSATPNAELKKKNEEDFVDIDGIRYFHTGDIGQIHPNGTLEIIDRKKDLWKGPNGEYVALTKVEAALKLCEFVDLPMCYGKTGGEFPVALICPQKPKILSLGAELALGDDFEKLCCHAEVVKRVSDACQAKCKEQKLAEFEIPKRFALIADLWTPENDMLTAAMKLKRPGIVAKHKEEIDKLYTA